jgi:PAS domain S-box-containing protein
MDDYQDELRLIKALLQKHPKGLSITEIARELGKNKHSVGRYLDVLRVSGQVEMRTYGMAKVFTLSRRVPISALLSHSPHELILWLDADLVIVQADENFLDFLQLSKDEVIGRNITHLSIPDLEVQDLIARIAGAVEEGAETLGDIRVAGADERYFHGEIMATVFESGEQGYVVILVDITRRKHAEIALRESEKKYRELVEHANSVILKMDTVGNLTFFNEFAQCFFGYTDDEVLGKNVVGTIVPETESSGRDMRQFIRDVCANPEEYINNENENVTKDGRRVWIQWTNRAIFDEHGTPVGVLSIGNDITEQKRAKEALEASEKRFRELVDLLPQPVFEADIDGRITFGNRMAFECFGYPPEDFPGDLTVLDVIAPEDRERAREDLRRILFEGEKSRQQYTALCRDGATFPFIEYTSPIRKGGRVVGLRGVVFDLTEQIMAEDTLNAERDFTDAVLDTVGAMVIVLDREGRVVRFNRAAEELTGFSEAEVKETPFWDLFVRAEDGDAVHDLFDQYLAGRRPGKGNTCYVDRNGEQHVVRWSNTVLSDDRGVISHVIVTGLDISERKQAEEDLRLCRSRFDQ